MFSLLAAVMIGLAVPPPASPSPMSRIRPVSDIARTILADAVKRSPTVAQLVAELQRSDVVVYLDAQQDHLTARGHTGVFAATSNTRFLQVVISLRLNINQRVELLGHELQHAVEIARAPMVRDEASFRTFYSKHGYQTGPMAYETEEARLVEQQVRTELFRKTTAPRPGTASR